MARRQISEAERFAGYLDRLNAVVGHRDRLPPLRAYLPGLLLPGERKSVEPMAAKLDPRHVRARHQSMHHFVANAPWSEEAMLRVAVNYALEQMARHGPVGAWLVDDTGFPKKGGYSVRVARQYCGILGKQDNCQVVVSVSLANATMSVPCFYRLYLPESWAKDQRRRVEEGVPEEIRFQPKWRIALAGIDHVLAEQLPPAPVVADAGYGDGTEFRDQLTVRGLGYIVGIKAETTIWPPGQRLLPPKPWCGRGRPPSRRVRDGAAAACVAYGALARGDTRHDGVTLRDEARPAGPR